MEEPFEHIVYSKNVLEFVTVAAEYCAFTENAEKIAKREFIEKSLKLFPLLYLKASLIPEVESELEGENEKFVTESDWMYISSKIGERLGEHDVFIQISIPNQIQDYETTDVSLAEVYADIYQDLQDFISLYRVGSVEVMNDALWECKLNFEQFWGQRLLDALSSLHNIYFGNDLLDENEDEK